MHHVVGVPVLHNRRIAEPVVSVANVPPDGELFEFKAAERVVTPVTPSVELKLPVVAERAARVVAPVTPSVELKLPVVAVIPCRVDVDEGAKVVHVRVEHPSPCRFVDPEATVNPALLTHNWPLHVICVLVSAAVFVTPRVEVPVTPNVEEKDPVVAVRPARVDAPVTPNVEENEPVVAVIAARVVAPVTPRVDEKDPVVAVRPARVDAPVTPSVEENEPVVAVMAARVVAPVTPRVVDTVVAFNELVPLGTKVVHVNAPVFVAPRVEVPVTPRVEENEPVVAVRAAIVDVPLGANVVQLNAPVFVTPRVLKSRQNVF